MRATPPLTVLALVAALSACEARLTLGAGCAYATECPSGLVCVAGRCRSECTSARDCPRGAICLTGEGGVGACQTLADTGCVGPADCGARLVCHGGQCTNDCVTDAECRPGAFCADRACVECVTSAECASGLVCRLARCVPECARDADCTGGLVCLAGRCGISDAGLSDAGPDFVPDTCERAQAIVLSGPRTALSISSTVEWTDDTESCSSLPDAFFRFDLARRSLVDIRVSGVPPSTSVDIGGLGWVDPRCTGGGAACDAHTCIDETRSIVGVRDAGTHAFVLDATGDPITIEITVLPIGDGTAVIPLANGRTVHTITLEGEGSGACASDGPDAVFYASVCETFTVGLEVCSSPVDLAVGHLTGEPPICDVVPAGTSPCDFAAGLTSGGGWGAHFVSVSAAQPASAVDVTLGFEIMLND